MNYVVDASIAVKWYVPEDDADAAERLLDAAHELHAPELIVPEFGNIIWKKIKRGEITEKQGQQIIKAFLSVPLLKYPHSPLLETAFDGATKTDQTVYDWMYLALAVALNYQMVTADEKFYQSLQKTTLAPHLLWVADIP